MRVVRPLMHMDIHKRCTLFVDRVTRALGVHVRKRSPERSRRKRYRDSRVPERAMMITGAFIHA